MGFIYSSLNKSDSESWSQFDNRIARMLPFVTGKVYFDLRNYDAQTGEFSVYVRWDAELEGVLEYALPCGGYFVKATIAQAYSLHKLGCGLPLYMKLISHNGRLYPYRTYIMLDGRPFSVEFGGGELIPVDDRFEELSCVDEREHQIATVSSSGSQRFQWNSSQMRQMFGSQGGFRYLTGSQYGGLRTTGSQRFRWNSSQMRQMFGSQGGFRYLTGSQYGGLRTTGSQRLVTAGDLKSPVSQREKPARASQDRMDELMMEFPQEWQLINRSRRPTKNIGGNARFGYGLDLI